MRKLAEAMEVDGIVSRRYAHDENDWDDDSPGSIYVREMVEFLRDSVNCSYEDVLCFKCCHMGNSAVRTSDILSGEWGPTYPTSMWEDNQFVGVRWEKNPKW